MYIAVVNNDTTYRSLLWPGVIYYVETSNIESPWYFAVKEWKIFC